MGKKNDVDNKFVMYQNTEEMVAHLTREKIYTVFPSVCMYTQVFHEKLLRKIS